MIKKLLHPLVVSAFIFVMILGCIAHLMYGHCQTTKWHYIVQAWVVPEYLPEWAWVDNVDNYYLKLYDNKYTGEWISYHKNGNKICYQNYINGVLNGKWSSWQSDGTKYCELYYKNGEFHGLVKFWHENGTLKIDATFKDGVITSFKAWDASGKTLTGSALHNDMECMMLFDLSSERAKKLKIKP